MELQKYRKYESYENSGIEWLGEIPVHWGIRRLKYVCSIINDKVSDLNENINYIGLEHIESEFGKLIDIGSSNDIEGTANSFKKGDVLFGKLRPYLAKVVLAEFDGIGTTELIVMRPFLLEKNYLYWRILSPKFIDIVNSSTYGAKMPRASWEFIGNLKFSIPPLEEQKQIASFLNKKTKTIDALLSKLQRQVELLKEKRIVLITQAVTKGLDPDVPMKDSGIEWLGEIPVHWEVMPIKRPFEVLNGATPKSSEEKYWNGEIIWATPEDLGKNNEMYLQETKRSISLLGFQNSSTKIAPKGSIILSIRAPIGHIALANNELCTNQGCMLLKLKSIIKSNSEFFYYLFVAFKDELKSWGQGTTFMELSKGKMENITLVTPPIEEQKQIASFLKDKTGLTDTLVNKINKQIELIKEYRQVLITNVVTGKIDVREEY